MPVLNGEYLPHIWFTSFFGGWFFPGGLGSQVSACSAGDPGSVPELGRSPGEGNGNPLQYSCWRIPWMEKPDGLQSLGLKQELDTTERPNSNRTMCCSFIHPFLHMFPVNAPQAPGPWSGADRWSGPRGDTWAQEAGLGPLGTGALFHPPKLGLLAAPSVHLVNSWGWGRAVFCSLAWGKAEDPS